MRTSELLHFAFRSRSPLALGMWYADLLDGQFFIHPVMTGLGIVIVKLNHPEAVFDGLLEFWPWDVVWDGQAAVFRKVAPKPSPTSYGHVAVKVAANADAVVAELKERGIPYRFEPRGPGFLIPVVDDPEGNMVELFPNLDHMDLPPGALCPRERAAQVIAQVTAHFEQKAAGLKPEDGVPLLLFEPGR
jgi:catechol 2,3-dioxygenase-like lactoylglutathione lyase family enzyme